MKLSTTFIALIASGSLAGLAGCADAPQATSSVSPTYTASPAPRPTTDANKALEATITLFDETNVRTSRKPSPTGTAFIAALQSAGFAAESLEVTADLTSVGLAAPSIQFAALIESTCLIGQYGPGDTGYRSVIVAPIATGGCLIGTTARPPSA